MNRYDFLGLLIILVTLIVCVALSAGIFNAVMASDLPDWAKYIILKS